MRLSHVQHRANNNTGNNNKKVIFAEHEWNEHCK